LLEKISVERSFIEFDKLLLAPYWRKGMLALIDSYAFNYLPCLKNRELQLSAFLSQLDKDFLFETSEQAWASLILSMEVEHTKTFLKKWKTSTHFQKDVEHIVDVYRIREQMGLTKEHLYRYGKTIIKQAEGIRKARGLMVDFEKIEQLDSELAIHDRHEIVVNGGTLIKKLGIKPGPQMGDIISQIELAIVLGQLINEEEAILHFVKQYLMD
ncbi:CCA-adding protein, partial [Streptococcus agalactiae LDS 610]